MMDGRTIRRRDRVISTDDSLEIIKTGEFGFLATVGPDGIPYGVPLSYVVIGPDIFFHSAHEGRKIENIKFQPKASFCVVGPVKAVYAGNFSTYYESAMAFGHLREITDAEEKTNALMKLAEKYLPEHMDKAPTDIARSLAQTAVYALTMEKVSGKAKKPRKP